MARIAARSLRELRSIFLAAVLGLCSVLHVAPITPKGRQCPTAPVQVVTEVTYEKDCCGKLVTRSIQRKPRDGELGFVQCRCAEKKAAETQQKTESSESSRFSLVAVLNPLVQFKLHLVSVPRNGCSVDVQAEVLDDQHEPLIPPPRSI